jgi:ribose transport system substrate-binding protein
MSELAKAMNDEGVVAILAGNQTAPNLQARVAGDKDEMAKHPRMRLLPDGVFFHLETPERAVEALNQAQSLHPEIQGWAMVGGWPLFAKEAVRWVPGSVKIVAVDALPAQLAYLETGHVEVLLAQDCYGWGRRSVEILVTKALDGKEPPGAPRLIDPLTRVSRQDARALAMKWEVWLAK